MNLKPIALVATALSLAACGGHDDDITPPDNGSDTTGTYRLESVPVTASAALQQLQRLGATRNAWVSSVTGYAVAAETANLYLQSSLRPNSTFQYAMETQPVTLSSTVAQLNARGAEGYAYKGSAVYDAIYTVFVKDTSRPATYRYESLDSTNSMSSLLGQLNAQGAQGNRWHSSYTTYAPNIVTWYANLYVKDSTGPATYTYSTISLGNAYAPASGSALLSSLRDGAVGGAYYRGTVLAGNDYVMVFERPAGPSTPIEYHIESVPAFESLSSMLETINSRADQGWFFWSDILTTDGKMHRIYVSGMVPPHPLYGLVYP